MPKSKAKTVSVTDIVWDTDGEKVDGLPEQVSVKIPASIKNRDEAEEYISDKLCKVSGFCHDGFTCNPNLSSLFKK